MIVDLNEHAAESLPEYDVCVVGSGPAGATVAAELADTDVRVCILESGLGHVTAHGDRLREVRSEGIHVKEWSRERVVGGASTTWAGLSSPFDAVDFEPRPGEPLTGWPVDAAEMRGLYAEAAARYRFPPIAFFGPEGFGALRSRSPMQPDWERVEEKVFLAAEEPQDFGREQRSVWAEGPVDLYMDATVLRFERGATGDGIEAAVVRTRGGRDHRLRARVFVVATGGIENARLLLRSRCACPDGLGNEHDQVGRYLMNHPKSYRGILVLREPSGDVPYFFGCLYEGFAGYAGLRLTTARMRAEGLLNAYVRFEPLFPWSDSQGVEALVTLVKRASFLLRFWKRTRRKKEEVTTLRDYSETGDDSEMQNARRSALGWIGLVGTILGDLPRVVKYAWFRAVTRKKPRIRRVRLRNFMEMEPVADNRVVLDEETDVYGEPLPRAIHDTTARDRRSLVLLHEELEREFERTGLGRLETDLATADPWPVDQDASHHMGTTRMGTDPATSVVDPNLRLHTVPNVYVAGASVFPTSGCANPTFTLVALSIRLARHLARDVLAEERP